MRNIAVQPSGTFQQYSYGPFYSWDIYPENVRNFTAQMVEARRHAMRSRRWEDRSNREWNALRYLEAKRALLFLTRQSP